MGNETLKPFLMNPGSNSEAATMATWMGVIYPEDEAAQQAPHLSSNSESDYSRSGSDSDVDDFSQNSEGEVIKAASNTLRKEVINRTLSDEDSTYSMSDISGVMEKKPKKGAGGWPSRKMEKYFSLSQGFKYGKKNVESSPTPPSSDYSSQEESPVPAEIKPWIADKREIQASEDINKFMTSNENKDDSIVEYCSSGDDQSGVPSMNGSSSVSTLSARSVDHGMDDSGTDIKAELQNLKSKLNNLGFKGPNAKKKHKKHASRAKDDRGQEKGKTREIADGQDAPTAEDASQVSSVMLNPKASDKDDVHLKKSSEQGGLFSNDMTDCCFVGEMPLASLLTGTIDEEKPVNDADIPPIRHVTFSTKTPEVFHACADTEFSCTPTIETESIQSASAVMLSYINSVAPSADEQWLTPKKDQSAQDSLSVPQVDMAVADTPGKELPFVHAPSEELRADKEGRQLRQRSQSKSTNGEEKNSTLTQTLVETIKIGATNFTSACGPETSSPIDEVIAEQLDDGSIVVSLITTDFPHDAHPGYNTQAKPHTDTKQGNVPEFIGSSSVSKDSLDGFLKQNLEVHGANVQNRTSSGVSAILNGDLKDQQPSTAIEMTIPRTPSVKQINGGNGVPSDANDLESGPRKSSGGNGNMGEVSRADMGESHESGGSGGDAEQEEAIPEEPQLEMVILPGDDFSSTQKQDVHDDTAARREVSRRLCVRLSVLGLLFVILLSLLIVFLRKDDENSTSMIIESSATTAPNVVVFTEPPEEIEVAETDSPEVDATNPPFTQGATPVPTESATCANRIGTDGFCYNAFSPIFVFFDNCDPLPDDWLGVYPAGSDPLNLPEPVFWVWTCGNQDCFAEIFSEAYTLNFNLAPGSYMLYLARQGNGFPPYQSYANSEEFIVVNEGVDCQQQN